jgi:hypothetical protein
MEQEASDVDLETEEGTQIFDCPYDEIKKENTDRLSFGVNFMWAKTTMQVCSVAHWLDIDTELHDFQLSPIVVRDPELKEVAARICRFENS